MAGAAERAARGRRWLIATLIVAAVWTVLLLALDIDGTTDADLIEALALATLSIPLLGAALASLATMPETEDMAAHRYRPHRTPRIELPAPCPHCGRHAARPQRNPRIVRPRRPRTPRLRLVPPRPLRRSPRIVAT